MPMSTTINIHAKQVRQIVDIMYANGNALAITFDDGAGDGIGLTIFGLPTAKAEALSAGVRAANVAAEAPTSTTYTIMVWVDGEPRHFDSYKKAVEHVEDFDRAMRINSDGTWSRCDGTLASYMTGAAVEDAEAAAHPHLVSTHRLSEAGSR